MAGTKATESASELSGVYLNAERLENGLFKKIYGQDDAVRRFVEGYFDSTIMPQPDTDRNAPRATFMFMGPRGVGKSYLAEQIADALNLPFIRFKMSGLGDDLQYRSLVGSASHRFPTEGALTGFVKAHPQSIVLFDGIERMHVETLEMVREILRTGLLRDDFLEEEVSFWETVIIFSTSEAYSPAAEAISAHIVNFSELQESDILRIATDELELCFKLFEDRYDIDVNAEDDLPKVLVASLETFHGTKHLRQCIFDFFKNELFEMRELFTGKETSALARNLKTIHFQLVKNEDEDAESSREILLSPDGHDITVKLFKPKLQKS